MATIHNASTAARIGTFNVLLTAFVLGTLYFAQDFLIPLALAALLTFLLSPLATRLERWIGRIASVLVVVGLIILVTMTGAWIITGQVVDLAAKLPDYKENIQTKLRALKVRPGGSFSRFSETLAELKKELPGDLQPTEKSFGSNQPPVSAPVPAPSAPVPVQVVPSSKASDLVRIVMPTVLGPLGTSALVLLLLIFMLLKRDDLRSRLVRLVGQGRISATTRAMEDASRRVSRYLLMQLLVNVSYGIPVGIGLYFIGVPNAPLWGLLAVGLRFIPYVGPWIAASIPIALSLAVFDNWTGPLLTVGLFVVLELLSNNVMEPWLYGSSTGVSPIALIIAAVFWTWFWGPIGLVLATPLTVCLAVMGRHVPRLHFLSVMLSDEQPLAPHEECYQRLLALDPNESVDVVETYLKANSLTALYDNVLIPVITAAEMDYRRQALDQPQLSSIHQSLREIIDDLAGRPASDSKTDENLVSHQYGIVAPNFPRCRILCLPARGERDELAGAMLIQLLNQERLDAENAAAALSNGEVLDLVEKKSIDAVCISVVPPSTIIHARYLSAKLRQKFPTVRIVVGLWGATDDVQQATQRLTTSGADEVVVSLAAAVVQLAKFCVTDNGEMTPAPIPVDEEQRLAELARVNVMDTEPEPVFDRVTKKLARIFGVPISLITFIDKERQFFKAQIGLPEDLVKARGTLRAVSLCGHVIGNNNTLVVEDLSRDPRFANNPFVHEQGLRFYAGVPLRTASGQPIGSLSVMDTKPRQVTEREARLLEVMAEDLMEEINRRAAVKDSVLATAPVVSNETTAPVTSAK